MPRPLAASPAEQTQPTLGEESLRLIPMPGLLHLQNNVR